MYTLTNHNNGFTVTFSASFDKIDSVCMDTQQFLKETGLGDYCFDILLGVREALTNAVRHGSEMDAGKQVVYSIDIDPERIRIHVADSGPGFNWQQTQGTCALPTATSGRGISIMGHYFDSYQYNGAGNEVTLEKTIK